MRLGTLKVKQKSLFSVKQKIGIRFVLNYLELTNIPILNLVTTPLFCLIFKKLYGIGNIQGNLIETKKKHI